MHVGGNNWYKNKEVLVCIFSEFLKIKKNKNYKLILAGKKITEELELLIEKLKLKNSIINLVNLNNETICALYSDAEALIFPSITLSKISITISSKKVAISKPLNFPFLSNELKLETNNRLYPNMLYDGVVHQNNNKLFLPPRS